MEMFKTYTGSHGQSQMADIIIPWAQIGGTEVFLPATGAQFCRIEKGANHTRPAERKHLVIGVSGHMHVTVGDGSRRTVGPGDLYLAEDTTGVGHTSEYETNVWQVWVTVPDWHPEVGVDYSLPKLPSMHITGKPIIARLFNAASDGETYIDRIDWNSFGKMTGSTNTWAPLKSIQFRRSIKQTDTGFHPGPRRQFIVNLAGGVEFTMSTGKKTRLRGGDVELIEDTNGKGHITNSSEERRTIWIIPQDDALPTPIF